MFTRVIKLEDFDKICRICCKSEENLHSIFKYKQDENSPLEDLSAQMRDCNTLVEEDDGLPSNVCINCISALKIAFYYTRTMKESYNFFQELLQSKPDPSSNSNQLDPELSSFIEMHNLDWSVLNNQRNDEMDFEWNEDMFSSDNDVFDSLINAAEREGEPPDESTCEIPIYYLCLCKERYISLDDYKRHIVLSLCTEIKEKQMFNCAGCNIFFLSYDSCERHEEFCSKLIQGVYRCSVNSKSCKKVLFTSRYNLELHLWRHNHSRIPRPTYQCGQCHRVYAAKKTLTNHINAHLNIKKYSCELCGKNMLTSSALNMHMRIHSENELPNCTNCDSSLLHNSCLINWKKTEPTKYTCFMCQSVFSTDSDMKTHIATAHNKIKKYECVICGLSYEKMSSLSEHVLTCTL